MKKIISILASCCLLCGTATAQTNTSYGTESFQSNTTGYYNSAFGKKALKSNTAGYGNTAVGYMSMLNITTGSFNTALGGFSLETNQSTENTAIGYKSQESATGGENVSLGHRSLQTGSGSHNVAIGNKTLMSTTTGYENTAVGSFCLPRVTTGYQNIGIGRYSLTGISSGSQNISLGYDAGYGLSTGTNNITMGTNTKFTGSSSYNIVIGYRSQSYNNNNIIIGKRITLPSTISNGLNIGGVLFGSGMQSNVEGPSSTPFSIPVGGKIGINVVSPTATLDVAGNVNLSTNITIGGVTAPWYKANSTDSTLRINGTIYSKEINVRTNVWADHVFSNGYQLPSLSSVEQYINTNKHLPEIPSEQEVKTNGVDLAQMNVLLLKKVEELTLHMIEQEKRIQELENHVK